ncbi:MAG: cupin domain-containing protein [Silicimonas sp.]|nr:cupin domain-containing protein [Silicimonas sp.]
MPPVFGKDMGDDMPKIGDSIVIELTGTTITIQDVNATGGKLLWESDQVTGIPEVPKHVHDSWQESFEIVKGSGRYFLNGWHTAKAGDVIQMPAKMPHVHPMAEGETPFEMIQTIQTAKTDEKQIMDTIGVLFSLFERRNHAPQKFDKLGFPKNPIHFAAAGKLLGDAGGFDARFPVWAQKLGGQTFGRLALMLHDPVAPKWK